MERREKKDRHKDRHEQQKAATNEMKKEDSPKPDPKQSQQDSRLSDNTKGGNSPVSATPATPLSAAATSKGIEGISQIRIPLSLIESHCILWDSSWEYQKFGYDLFGIVRYASDQDSHDSSNNSMVTLFTEHSNYAQKWAIDMKITEDTIRNCAKVSNNRKVAFYKYLFKKIRKLCEREERGILDQSQSDCDIEQNPDSIGFALHEKMRQHAEAMKQQKRAKMKARYKKPHKSEGGKKGKESPEKKDKPVQAGKNSSQDNGKGRKKINVVSNDGVAASNPGTDRNHPSNGELGSANNSRIGTKPKSKKSKQKSKSNSEGTSQNSGYSTVRVSDTDGKKETVTIGATAELPSERQFQNLGVN